VTLLVDTSVWSLALRRDDPTPVPEVEALHRALEGHAEVLTTGLILQELLQGFPGPGSRVALIGHLGALPLVTPERRDHIEAADLRNRCGRAGIQLGTMDALIAQLCIRHRLTLLTTDDDFSRIARREALRLWTGSGPARRH
jgi:predicted nucleic acid-binding protein